MRSMRMNGLMRRVKMEMVKIQEVEEWDEAFATVESVQTTGTVTTLNNSDFTVVIVTVGSASGSLKAEPKECLTGKGQVLSKGLRAERISRWLTSILLLIKIV